MDLIFCCSAIKPFKPHIIDNEAKFKSFLNWARESKAASANAVSNASEVLSSKACFVVQLVRQVNYGPLESKKYFAKTADAVVSFSEVTEQDLIDANYQKVNSFKNFKCVAHNKFFELNLYERDPVNRHHWRANIARPATEIDLPLNTMSISDSVKPVVFVEALQPLKNQQVVNSDFTQSFSTNSNPKSTLTTSSTSSMFFPLGRHARVLEADTEKAHGQMGERDGNGNLPRQTPHQLHIEEMEHMSGDDRFGGYGSDDDRFGEGDWSGSRGSQSPHDFTACSADHCGNCGHCSY